MEPKKIIFDTDLGGDCDDVIALDLILSAAKAGECELIGITYSYFCFAACGCIYEILRQYGYENVPLGRMPIPEGRKEFHGAYAYPVVEKFGKADTPKYADVPDAVKLLRKLLSENENVTLVVVGSMTNIASLIESAPDDISPLDGKELMKRSVKEIAVMGCSFRHQDARNPQPDAIMEDGTLKPVCEWNIYCDIPAARKMFDTCPVPITCSPFELGFNLYSGQPIYDAGKGETPDSYSMQVYGCFKHGHHSWDPATAYYALYGALPYFYKTVRGKITIDENGISYFDASHGGDHCLIECAMPREQIGKAIDEKLSRLAKR